jgi:phage RecT family recombinase
MANQPPRPPGTNVVVNTLKAQEMQTVLKAALPRDVPLDRFTDATIAAMNANPDIFECERNSLYNAIAQAARKGILPDGKQGALAPFNTKVGDKWVKKAQFMIMPEGIIAAFAKVGITAYAQSVYENDTIRLWSDDSGQHIEHTYDPFGQRGARTGAYACGRTKGGVVYVEAMGLEDLKKVRSKSRSPDKGPWAEWTDRMEQKSALHRLDKRMPGAGVAGEDDEPENVVATVPEAGQSVSGGGSATESQQPTTEAPKRPRGLQAVIDSAEEADVVTDAEIQDGHPDDESIQSNNGEVF